MPCFEKEDPKLTIAKFVERLNGNKSEVELIRFVDDLIYYSIYNWRTIQYDNFQKFTNDIYP
jgi:phosphatidylinositol kinase/protein kinase (PI-3  family)